MDRGWSLKAMHRLIVTSATYRQSSRVTPQLAERDPQNKLFARGPRVRLEAELVRDSVLGRVRLAQQQARRAERLSAAAPAITTEGTYGGWPGTSARAKTAIAAASTRSASGPPRTRCSATFDAPSGEACLARRELRTRRCRR